MDSHGAEDNIAIFPRLFGNATDSVLECYTTNYAFVLIICGIVTILNYKNYHTVKY